MKYKAIIFDMDGTIVDTEHIWNRATQELIIRRGVALTPELKQDLASKLNGMAITQSCSIIKTLTQSQDSVESLVQEKSRLACELYTQAGVTFIQGFVEFHQKAKTLELKTGLATNADDATLEITNRMLKLERFFDKHMYNLSCVSKGKPHPDIYLHTAQKLGINPGECIAIEDSAHGIAAAKAAGMFCIGINTSKNPEQIKHADLQIDGYHEIELHNLIRVVVAK